MKKIFGIILLSSLSFIAFACSQKSNQTQSVSPAQSQNLKLNQEQYIALMTELGCKRNLENTPGALETYKKFGVAQDDIQAFRKGNKAEVMMKVATQIASNVAACFNVAMPHN